MLMCWCAAVTGDFPPEKLVVKQSLKLEVKR